MRDIQGFILPEAGLALNDPSLLISSFVVLAAQPARPVLTSDIVNTGEFSATSITYSVDQSGSATAMTIDWTLSSNLEQGEKVTITLPGFHGPSADLVALPLTGERVEGGE
jgi:hypothetical protein